MESNIVLRFVLTLDASPVQAEGTVAWRPFYFRARHQSWSFGVAERADVDPVLVDDTSAEDGSGWYQEGHVPGPSGASYMPLAEAEALIRACAEHYVRLRGAAEPGVGGLLPRKQD